MLREDLDPDGDEDDAAEYGGLVFHQHAEFFSCKGAEEAAERRDDADEGNGKAGIRVGEGHRQGDSRRQGIDAGCHRLGEDETVSKGPRVAGLLGIAQASDGFREHFSAQESQKDQGDPMVDRFHVAAEGCSCQIPNQGHQCLKDTEACCGDDQLLFLVLITDAV